MGAGDPGSAVSGAAKRLGIQTSGAMPSGSIGGQGIYMGQEDVYDPIRDKAVKRDKYQTYAEASAAPTTWSDQQLNNFIRQGTMRKIRGFSMEMGLPDVMKAWGDMVDASRAMSSNFARYSPWDIMNSYGDGSTGRGTYKDGAWEYDATTGQRLRFLGATKKTTTSKQVDLSSYADVEALTKSVLIQALGRAPSAAEVASFKKTLNSEERANPTVATTTSTLSPNLQTGEVETTQQSTTTSGGLSAEAKAGLVEEKAQATPEYGAYQAATTYMNSLMQMMGG